MTEKKIALILTGGVSLGAYQAGVLTELLYLLETHNAQNPTARFVIDVVSASSGGSVNAALLAKVMMLERDSRCILHDFWVEDAAIDKLLAHPGSNALFSTQYQRQMGERYLNVNGGNITPASYAPEQLKLCFCLSNMVGVDYGFPFGFSEQQAAEQPSKDQFAWSFFDDCQKLSVQKGDHFSPEIWQASTASSGFPLAFAPLALPRAPGNFPGSLIDSVVTGPHLMSAAGGPFESDPVRQAIELAKELDGGRVQSERLFILIDPTVNCSKVDAGFVNGSCSDMPADPIKNLSRLLGMNRNQSAARSWLKTGEFNQRLQWQESLVDGLPELINAIAADQVENVLAKQLAKTTALLKQLATSKLGSSADPETLCNSSLNKIRQSFSTPFFATGVTGESETLFSQRRKILLNMIFEINCAGSLADKSPINLFLFGASREQSVGDDFFSVSGFFEKKWREHDFRLGRRKAHRLIPGALQAGLFSPESGATYQNDEQWGDLGKADIGQADHHLRSAFYNRVLHVLDQSLRRGACNLGWIQRMWLRSVLRNALRKKLEL